MNQDFKDLVGNIPWQFKLWWLFCATFGLSLSGLVIYILVKLAMKL